VTGAAPVAAPAAGVGGAAGAGGNFSLPEVMRLVGFCLLRSDKLTPISSPPFLISPFVLNIS
jgi:hypothetical protein